MRYSRFKKQMDGTATARRPRGPNSPRKSKVEKNKSPRKGKGKAKEEDEESQSSGIKAEPGMSSRQGTAESEAVSERMEKRVKLEPGLRFGAASTSHSESQPTPRTMPNTPTSSSRYVREASASPSPGPHSDHERFDAGEMDEMGFSFGMHGDEPGMPGMPGMYAPLIGGEFEMGHLGGIGGMGMQMGMGDMYKGLWQGNSHGGNGGQRMHGEGGVHVKTEPRWEEAYRHV
jgi:hypothetical protein